VIHLDPALGEELFDVAEGQARAQVPADSDDDDIGREPEAGEAERGGIDGRERSAILMTESHRTRRFTVNATEPSLVGSHAAGMPDGWATVCVAVRGHGALVAL
jgi:hypothetical protein